MFCAKPEPGGQAGVAVGKRPQRHSVGRDGAAVDADWRVVERNAERPLQGAAHLPLHPMVLGDVAWHSHALGAGQTDKTGVLARAIVVQGGRLPALTRQGVRGRLMGRPMGAALQRLPVEPDFPQHRARQRHMPWLATVRGAAQRQRLVVEAKPIGGAALDQWHGLHRLDRGTRKDRARNVAAGEHQRAVGVDDRRRAAMARFDEAAARHFDENRIGRHKRLRITPRNARRRRRIASQAIRLPTGLSTQQPVPNGKAEERRKPDKAVVEATIVTLVRRGKTARAERNAQSVGGRGQRSES